MILAIGTLGLIAVLALLWVSVGRETLRLGYVAMTNTPSVEAGGRDTIRDAARHEGVLHLVMADHVDPGLMLVVLRLDDGGQWISTVRTDQQGFGGRRLDSWRASARRVVIDEKPRAHEVVFRPVTGRHASSLRTRIERGLVPVRRLDSANNHDASDGSVGDGGQHSQPVPRLRLLFALGLAAVSIASSLVLMFTDGIDAGVSWTHHAGVSAAPLLLIAGALLAVSIAVPPAGKAAVFRAVTVTAFTTWGLSQLLPNTGAGTVLDDVAILLFVIDAAVFVASDSLGLLRKGRVGQLEADPARDVSTEEGGRVA